MLLQTVRTQRLMMLVLVLASSLLSSERAEAQIVPQYGQFQPLNQNLSPGLAGQWAVMAGKGSGHWSQPIQITLDGGGDVTVYHGRPVQETTHRSPAQLGVSLGHLYRLRVSNMPDLPGVEIYPTIEIIDRLHPPAGKKHDFPIPVYIDRDDIDSAINGNLVTRVVYIEQPQLAAPFALDDSTRVRTLLPAQNVLEQADRYGRPAVIVRIGGRLPSLHGESAAFYGTGGFISHSTPRPVDQKQNQPDPHTPLTSSVSQNGRSTPE
ncbi:MAG: hypothetical protein HQ518_09600 [Rhodopirellula sp.]|nr:hypothetical protein [Rhodopirellula sp.]